MSSGSGSRLYDVDGNEFIDYIQGFGAIVLGYSHPKVTRAAQEQLEKVSLHGMACDLEIEFPSGQKDFDFRS